MRELILAFGLFASVVAGAAIATFVRTCRKPPPVPDLDKDWLGN